MGNEDAFTRFSDNNLAYLEGLRALKMGDSTKAKSYAKRMWDIMEPMKDAAKHEQYHLLVGLIAAEDEDYKAAVESFERSDHTDIYEKYHKALAYHKMQDSEKASKLFMELKDFNFNQVDYALIRADTIAMANKVQ
ncbi:hypothetical protein [Glaciecola sp. MF2-115]|uniref:hypothetical protein n=1 Tax=Glaciecola sp. MF2-115 TaxID=3384827 RepID=UPI00399F064F